jgi:hypothetical protein
MGLFFAPFDAPRSEREVIRFYVVQWLCFAFPVLRNIR